MTAVFRRLALCQRGSNAVEFALLAPVLMVMLFGVISYGYVFGIYHGAQQIAAEAARASVSGLSDPEREAIARSYVADNIASYSLFNPEKLQVITAQSGPPRQTFEVAIRYDMSDTAFARLASLVALPSLVVERRAVVQRGGY